MLCRQSNSIGRCKHQPVCLSIFCLEHESWYSFLKIQEKCILRQKSLHLTQKYCQGPYIKYHHKDSVSVSQQVCSTYQKDLTKGKRTTGQPSLGHSRLLKEKRQTEKFKYPAEECMHGNTQMTMEAKTLVTTSRKITFPLSFFVCILEARR